MNKPTFSTKGEAFLELVSILPHSPEGLCSMDSYNKSQQDAQVLKFT
jgi:hypothetical protein